MGGDYVSILPLISVMSSEKFNLSTQNKNVPFRVQHSKKKSCPIRTLRDSYP